MKLRILYNREIRDVQRDFNEAYPYLEIEFYKNTNNTKSEIFNAKRLDNSIMISAAGSLNEGDIIIGDTMTVGQLENSFKDKFGLMVQLSRKSGIIWLQTTMTDKWTLKQQNDHGKELSEYDESAP